MNRIKAIAGLTFRSSVRSRVLILLTALIVISVLCLPLIIKGDGTPAGMARLYIHYALSWAVILISLTTLWIGAGAFSQEIENRQVHLLTTKPVRAFQIWTGKWLGLLLVNAVLLGLAGLLAYAMLLWSARPAVLPDPERRALREEILTARRAIRLNPVQAAHADVNQMGPAHPGRVGTGPDGELSWQFTPPARIRPDDVILVQFSFASSRVTDTAPIKMLWMAGTETEPDRHTILTDAAPNVPHVFRLPARALDPNGTMKITYRNIEQERPSYVLFSKYEGVQVLVRKGSFEMNYARTLLVLFARLSFFSALGLAAGALFSFPTAVFSAIAFLFMTGFSRFLESAAFTGLRDMSELRGMETVLLFEPVLRRMFIFLNAIMPPLWQYDPFEPLSAGLLVSWRMTGSAFIVFFCLYSGALALVSGWLFSRREFT